MNSRLHDLRARLHSYRDFEDALLHDLRWLDYGRTVELDLEYVWRGDGRIRDDSDPKVIVTLRLTLVQELEVHNKLNQAQLLEPERMDWGMGVVALCELEDISQTYPESPIPMFEMFLRRESRSWIRIHFSNLEMSEAREE